MGPTQREPPVAPVPSSLIEGGMQTCMAMLRSRMNGLGVDYLQCIAKNWRGCCEAAGGPSKPPRKTDVDFDVDFCRFLAISVDVSKPRVSGSEINKNRQK
jgi:hypothetical protein